MSLTRVSNSIKFRLFIVFETVSIKSWVRTLEISPLSSACVIFIWPSSVGLFDFLLDLRDRFEVEREELEELPLSEEESYFRFFRFKALNSGERAVISILDSSKATFLIVRLDLFESKLLLLGRPSTSFKSLEGSLCSTSLETMISISLLFLSDYFRSTILIQIFS